LIGWLHKKMRNESDYVKRYRVFEKEKNYRG